MSDDDIVIVKDLVKRYKQGNVLAVDNLNLRIRRGEIYALIGANGSGKTTTLNIISGSLKPTSGSVEVMGLEIPKYRHELSKHFGVAPQEYSIYLDLTVKENVMFFAELYGVDRKKAKEKFAELLEVLKLKDKENIRGARLSGGMKRRVSIACALIHEPSLVIFDEATVGVDPILRKWFWEYFRELRNNGTTIIITSHVMDEAERADRIGLMRKGRLIEEGTPSELKEKHGVKNIEEVFIKLSGGIAVEN